MKEAFGEPLGAMEPGQEQAPEQLLDGRGVERRKREELPVRCENPFCYEPMDVGVEIREGPEGLNRGDAARPNVLAPEQLLEAEQDGIIGRAGEQAQELALAFEQAADGSG